jgi:hypothetical protein
LQPRLLSRPGCRAYACMLLACRQCLGVCRARSVTPQMPLTPPPANCTQFTATAAAAVGRRARLVAGRVVCARLSPCCRLAMMDGNASTRLPPMQRGQASHCCCIGLGAPSRKKSRSAHQQPLLLPAAHLRLSRRPTPDQMAVVLVSTTASPHSQRERQDARQARSSNARS